MNQKRSYIHVVATEPGWRAIYNDDSGLYVGEAIIGWRIETFDGDDVADPQSYVRGIGTAEQTASNCVGYQRPDGAIELMLDGIFESLAAAEAASGCAASANVPIMCCSASSASRALPKRCPGSFASSLFNSG